MAGWVVCMARRAAGSAGAERAVSGPPGAGRQARIAGGLLPCCPRHVAMPQAGGRARKVGCRRQAAAHPRRARPPPAACCCTAAGRGPRIAASCEHEGRWRRWAGAPSGAVGQARPKPLRGAPGPGGGQGPGARNVLHGCRCLHPAARLCGLGARELCGAGATLRSPVNVLSSRLRGDAGGEKRLGPRVEAGRAPHP